MLQTLSLITALAGTASALLVSQSSPCEQYCGNVLSSTSGSDMVCNDSEYAGNLAGTVFETCIKCELTSAYTTGNTSDLDYLLYNLRYQISYCLFGQQNNPVFEDTPCITSTACGPLENAFDWKNMSTSVGSYDFCQDWIEASVPKCEACLAAGDDYFTRNYVTILDAACRQKPSSGSTLSITGTPFATTPMNITTPSETPLYTYTPPNEVISLGGKVGIAIGGLVLLLSLAGFLIVCLGRRRRRAFLRSLESKYGGNNGGTKNWPSPPGGNPHDSMFGTPMSQKPLRGWDDTSPITAMSDSTSHMGGIDKNALFPRYFSPYNSQYNSPISATDGPSNAVWPTMDSMAAMQASGLGLSGFAGGSGFDSSPIGYGQDSKPSQFQQASVASSSNVDAGVGPSNSGATVNESGYTLEEYERMAHEHELAQIGLAMGGSDPSLRNKNSNVSLSVDTAAALGPTRPPPVQIHGEPSPMNSSPSSLSSLSVSAGALWEKPIKAKIVTMRRASKSGSGSQGSANEVYELREIDSNGAPVNMPSPPPPQSMPGAPILQHPGYGRNQQQEYYQPYAQSQDAQEDLKQKQPLKFYPPPPSPKWQSPYDGAI
ncbi:centromere microtubule binding protein cbf5-like protein [Ophiostoma piceae UAMH 11346]|uniref:Centromere microtubule binding protein cbf5-like protein n=1 Tax=Ophiostoma piceae (strain UAMH 11346) TaxID=1262450 RepID=S3BU15_OPHP1|nr:centromere microtubule binding protein cbf5-like protein [Ophiostoma piceae UAMH 11346]